jgi:hypothetical protein
MTYQVSVIYPKKKTCSTDAILNLAIFFFPSKTTCRTDLFIYFLFGETTAAQKPGIFEYVCSIILSGEFSGS